jgi:GNAT superfamily N-acetyltransferase
MSVFSNSVRTRKIVSDDLVDVGSFLHAHLNRRLSAATWTVSIVPPWQGTTRDPDDAYGHLLEDDGRIVGVQLVFSSRRDLGSGPVTIRNLGALCVLPAYRGQSIRLLRMAMAGRDNHLTDLSPSGAVVALNERFGFTGLDTATALVPALPGRSSRRGFPGRTHVVSDPDRIAHCLDGRDLEIYRDHRDARASHHVVLERGRESCYVMWRRDRRKRLPVFASVLYTSDPAVLHSLFPALSRHLLLRHGIPAVLAELRVVGLRPRSSIMLNSPRPKMFRSRTLPESAIDYLYSELTCVAW